ncbi:MAG: NUDIX domain-containing protein [Candidatus Aenigmarchaeota archaeon]|nr:NUDIX domain-containing protein [Candidatus Aenigmarchaeota archaeon]
MVDSEFVDVVNEKDEVIGKIPWREADKPSKERITRAAVVLVFNPKGELFLQKRSRNKIHYPLHWTDSVSGWVDSGETYLEAALREMEEEIGLKREPEDLELLFKIMVETGKREFVCVYRLVTYDPLKLNRAEIEEGRFFKIGEIQQMIDAGEKISPFFLEIFKKCLQKQI